MAVVAATVLLLVSWSQWLSLCDGCTVKTSDKEYDLTYFSQLSNMYVYDNDSSLFRYQWQICGNCANNCTNTATNKNEAGNVYLTESGDCNLVLSKWITSDMVVSDYSSHGEKGITIELYNGDTCTSSEQYGTNIRILCGKTDLDSITAKQKSSCRFNFVIKSSLVCSGEEISHGSSGLSWGWLSIILGFVLLILLFGIGYVIKGKRKGSWKCKDAFPCYNFCCLLPRYTWAGCQVTYEKLTSLRGIKKVKKTGDVGDDGLLDEDDDDDVGIITPADNDPDIDHGAR